MSAIGPGDWVEALPGAELLVAGSLYCVEALDADATACSACGDDGPGVDLVGVTPLGEGCYCAQCDLRPIYRPNADLIEQLKQPAPEIERELTDA